jgi:4-hydroxybenzoyl-CoA thioesterase
MTWSRAYPLRFAHCDPAGIAYYPRYFEICDAAIEDWTAEVIGITRPVMHEAMRRGMPTVMLNAQFAAVSHYGDMLDIAINATAVGRTSIELTASISCGGDPRFSVEYKQVFMNLDTQRAEAWPDEIRLRIEAALVG